MPRWMDKRTSGMFQRWQRRYFVLSGHYLRYYNVRRIGDPP